MNQTTSTPGPTPTTDQRAIEAWQELQDKWSAINNAERARSRACRAWSEIDDPNKGSVEYKAWQDAVAHHEMLLSQFFWDFHRFDVDYGYDAFRVPGRNL